jgi:LuxR family transcriptional regulator, maltose regulon positive regulatory protein
VIRVEVLGPLRVLVDGRPVEHPALRRARVRAVLAILCVDGPISRERLADHLWPDRDAESASRNLRVTLTHLRRLLAGNGGATSSPLVGDGARLRLGGTDRFSVDLWDARALLDRARRAAAAGAPAEAEGALAGAVALWRGEALPDLCFVEGFTATREGLDLQLTDAALTLAEHRLAEGRAAEALALAERAGAGSHSERAARLAIAAHLQRGDAARLTAAVAALRALLDDLAVEPEPATRILLRQVIRSHRLAPAGTAARN